MNEWANSKEFLSVEPHSLISQSLWEHKHYLEAHLLIPLFSLEEYEGETAINLDE